MQTMSAARTPAPTPARRLPFWTPGIALALGLVFGAVTAHAATSGRGVPRVVRGTITAVSADGTAIGFTEDGSDREGEGHGYWPAKLVVWVHCLS